MTLWQIALKNVWQNRNSYLAYLGSSAFSVMIYFLYGSLVYHPKLQGGYYYAAHAVRGMRAASVVIAIFTFLFLLYSNSAFIHSRMKEFGLLSLLGVSKRQLTQIILLESLLIAAVSIVVGLSLGMTFMKLFFMAISAVLQLPEQIPINTGRQVWTHTLAVFCTFFAVVSLASLRGVVGRNTIELIRAGREPKATPRFSRWKAALGLLLVFGGYLWAGMRNPLMVAFGIIPVTAMVSIGTYLLIQEGSVALLSFLHRRERLFYRPGPFLIISQLVHKMQENYRVLSAVTILVAVILSAMGTVFALYRKVTNDSIAAYPHAFQLTHGRDTAADIARVDGVLRKQGLTDVRFSALTVRTANLSNAKYEVNLVPYSFYAMVNRARGNALTLPGENGAILVRPTGAVVSVVGDKETETANLIVDGKSVPVVMAIDRSASVFNRDGLEAYSLVLPDAMHAAIIDQTPAEKRIGVAVWDTPAWKSVAVQEVAEGLKAHFSSRTGVTFSSTTLAYRLALSTMGILLFIGFFVSLVFFAACCSLLYFRLFTEIDDDRKYFRQLQQIGVNDSELKHLALTQAAVIFLTPFLFGMIHSTFAMQALGTLMAKTVLQLGWMVAAGYMLLYLAYFGATFAIYWRTLSGALSRRNEAMS